MLKLGKQTQYALVALFHLDRVDPGARVSTHELSQRYDIPEPHLGKVLQKLSRSGLLTAVKGVQGGYELQSGLDEMSLGDLMTALERKSTRDRQGHTILRVFPSCYVQGMVREVERRAIAHLHEMNLNDLLTEMEVPELSVLPQEMSI
ncbi:Rrf2 family transcriptional regulator [Kiritimatiellaeota bacterium B1221]|nr:Rrf2 family transcriptional regulator [Kiritimatiellaeota bacterium B1221]